MGSLEIVAYTQEHFDDREVIISLLTDFSHQLSKTHAGFEHFSMGRSLAQGQMESFDRQDHTLLIAKLEGNVIGCVGLRPHENSFYENSCEMIFLFVKPAFRGFGFGHQLLSSFLDLARENNYNHVLFDPLQDHEAIRQLYEDFGFQEIPPLEHDATASTTRLMLSL